MSTVKLDSRIGDWIQTWGGIRFYPADPRPEDIRIEDIAHALSHQCRFSGHTSVFYSVADHSLRVAALCPPGDRLWGLLHDASEAYLVDIPRPLKALPEFAGYRTLEADLMRVIARRFNLPEQMPPSVKRADEVLLATEARDFMGPSVADWKPFREPALKDRIVPRRSEEACRDFLSLFHALMAPEGLES